MPLTTSLYVPGKLASTHTVLVDIGTGFYVEKVRGPYPYANTLPSQLSVLLPPFLALYKLTQRLNTDTKSSTRILHRESR